MKKTSEEKKFLDFKCDVINVIDLYKVENNHLGKLLLVYMPTYFINLKNLIQEREGLLTSKIKFISY